MIKARAGNLLIFGISDENIRRLREGDPMRFSLEVLELPELQVLIFWGATLKDMTDTLKRFGTIDKNTKQYGTALTEVATSSPPAPPVTERTDQPVGAMPMNIEQARLEATRCRQYPNRVLNEEAICVLADKCDELAMLLVECRDALPAITLAKARERHIDLGLADRVELAISAWACEPDTPGAR